VRGEVVTTMWEIAVRRITLSTSPLANNGEWSLSRKRKPSLTVTWMSMSS